MTLAPPAPYYGGKQRIAPEIVRLLPSHEHYVEPFCGGLSVLMAKAPSHLETVNDLDGDLMTFWRVLRDQPNDLARVCALTPHSRAEHADAHDRDGLPDLERARRVWVKLSQGRTGTLRNTGWRFYINPAGTSVGMPGYLDGYVRRMAAAAERLHRVSLESRPALELVEAYGAEPSALLYVDPPYLGSTRTGLGYRHEMTGDAEHRELADTLRAARATVVLSGYSSPLYADLYDGWHQTTLDASTGQGGAFTARSEVLWSNAPLNNTPNMLALLEGDPS